MKSVKTKILAIFGTISTFLGGIGIAIAELGLCACVLAPIFSLAGIISISMSFLSENKMNFLIIGAVLLLISFIFYKRKRLCPVHRKGKK